MRICSNHFVDEDYERNLRYEWLGYQQKRFRSLKKRAVPSKNLPNRENNPSKSDRVQRQIKRQDKKTVEQILKEKQKEFLRILLTKGSVKTLSESAKIVLCLDLSTSFLGISFDKETAIKLSGLKKVGLPEQFTYSRKNTRFRQTIDNI
ncbi:hypothetical protein NQ318_022770 [Aromia moschata]|uniref:ORC6 first cyclin-like domain-containing protein n=1 Tax=Aromia moschata TaxID=1265417 RepID=A0AAV8YD92_9CUCU|nr:hypothetical protein NQ318_022770 [Aromia moschata]